MSVDEFVTRTQPKIDSVTSVLKMIITWTTATLAILEAVQKAAEMVRS